MRIIRNDKQKDNLAKVFWDMGKVPLTFQKLRMLQILGDEGEAVVLLPRTLDNAGGVVSSAFPPGK